MNTSDRGNVPSAFAKSYGDFNFVPWAMDCSYCERKEIRFPCSGHVHEPLCLELLFGGSSLQNTILPVSNEARGSRFPFLRLPKELRRLVIDWVVQPFRGTSGSGTVHVTVNALGRYRGRGPIPTCNSVRNNYELEIPIATAAGSKRFELAHGHLEFEDYDVIWALSKVCHQLRQELGEAFWNDVHISSMVKSSTPALLNFFEERPLVAQGVRFFSLEVTFANSSCEACQELIRICEFMAKHMSLQILELRLHIVHEELWRALATNGELDWMHAIRSIGARELHISGCRLTNYRKVPGSLFESYLKTNVREFTADGYDYFREPHVLVKLITPLLCQKRVQSGELTAAERYIFQSGRKYEANDLLTDQPWFSDSPVTIW